MPPSLETLARSYARPTSPVPLRVALVAVGLTSAFGVAAHVYQRSHSVAKAAGWGLGVALLPGV